MMMLNIYLPKLGAFQEFQFFLINPYIC